MERCRWSLRSDRILLLDAHQARRDRPRLPRGRTRARHASFCRAESADSDGYAHAPECWSSRPWRRRTRLRVTACPARCARTGPGCAPPWPGSARVTREDPAAMLPRADGILVQPPPDGAVADARHQARLSRVLRHVSNAQPRQRQAQRCRQFAGERLDLNGQLWGEKPGGVLGGPVRQGPPIDP